MTRALLIVLTSLSLLGCGESASTAGSEGGAGGAGGDGGDGGDAPLGVASLGIDPLGRGDGIDLTQSSYTGRCYEDDELEANRPTLPDPRVVAAEDAEEVALESQAAADAARATLLEAEQAFEASFTTQANAPEPGFSTAAGFAYIAAVTLAKDLSEEAYQAGLVLLAPEKATTWDDLARYPDKIITELVPKFIEARFSVLDSPPLLDLATELLTESIKAQMLEFLKDARDAALGLYEAATVKVMSGSAEPVASLEAQETFEAAQRAYDEAVTQAIADGTAAIDALIFVDSEPSEFPPCDSEELRQTLDEAFCGGSFVNPITPEQEAQTPGITERLDAYVDRVCAAVR